MFPVPKMPLIRKTPAEEVLKELVEFAFKKENWFQNPHESAEARKIRTDPRPEGGSHATSTRRFTAQLASGGEERYQVAFTITVAVPLGQEPGKGPGEVLLRHATIGVGDMSRLPDETEAFTILSVLGFDFNEPASETPHPDFPAMVFLQPVKPQEDASLRSQ